MNNEHRNVTSDAAFSSLNGSYSPKQALAPIPSATVLGQQVVPVFGGSAGYKINLGTGQGPYLRFAEYGKSNWSYMSRSCGQSN